MRKGWRVTYYISTVVLSLGMLMGAYFELSGVPEAVAGITHLGYPAYLVTIIGVAKLLGVIGIWQNKVLFLREWAYAGFVIDLAGAFFSHLAVGDGPAIYSSSLIGLAITIVSYVALKKKSA